MYKHNMTSHMNKKLQQGFTLIELLVVIAIIGILAAMVITNLRTARAKARDASAITSMSSARAEAENFYDSNSLSYGTGTGGGSTNICDPASNFGRLMTAAEDANGGTANCNAADQSYTAYINMTATTDNFCIDGTGFAGKINGAPSAVGDKCQ